MKGVISFCVILLILSSVTHAQLFQKKCRALVLEGGGDKGAYQVGGIRGLVENMPPAESKYDVLSGVSIGAINAVGFSFFKKGQELEASQFLLDFWGELSADVVYSNWPGYVIEGAFWRNGFYNNTRFVDFLQDYVHFEKVERKVVVGATNAKTGKFVRFTEKVGRDELMFDATRASSAFPGFFQSVNYQNMTLIDGGVLINLDIAGAVDRCKEMGFKEKDIILDIVMCSGNVLTDVDPEDFNAAKMFRRYFQINSYQKTMGLITNGKANFPHVNFRYVVAPSSPVSKEFIPLGFKQKDIQRMIKLGYNDAQKVVEMGAGKMADHLVNYYSDATGTSSEGFEDETFDEYLLRVAKE